MIKTYEAKPQVIVNVNGLPAVCHNLTCDFTYITTPSEITEFTYTAVTKKLVITGTKFPAKSTDIQSISFAMTPCTQNSAVYSETKIECTLTKNPTAGTHWPEVTSRFGKIPVKSSLAKTKITPTYSNTVPNSNLNLLGGDNITLTGTNFPHELATSTISLKFSDS
jgi:hypothetical protein